MTKRSISVFARDERRQKFDDVDVVRGHLGQDVVAVEERDDERLGEHRGAGRLDHTLAPFGLARDWVRPNSMPII